MPITPCTVTIAPIEPDGPYESVYCRDGGALEAAGFVLYNYYDDPDKARALIRCGNISSLAPSIRDCAFDAKSGEDPKIIRARMYDMLCGSIGINYLFDGRMWIISGERGKDPVPLEIALAEDYKRSGPVKALLEARLEKNPATAELIEKLKTALRQAKKAG